MASPIANALKTSPTALKMVIYGQGSTENRTATLVRFSDGLREELAAVAQGQFYLVLEYAVRRLIDDLRTQPDGQVLAIDAATMPGAPAQALRKPAARKTTGARNAK